MKDNQLTFNKMLTWNDIIQLGDPRGYVSVHFGTKIMTSCCTKKYYQNLYLENIKKFFIEPFLEEMPDFPFSMEDFDFKISLVQDNENNWKMKVSQPYFIAFLLEKALIDKIDVSQENELLYKIAYTTGDLKQEIVNFLKQGKLSISKDICRLNYNDPKHEFLLNQRHNINWCIKNIDHIFEFIDREINIDMLEPVDKDRFLLHMVSLAFIGTGLADFYRGQVPIEDILCPLDEGETLPSFDYLSNYCLMVDYLNQENGVPYNSSILCDLKNGGQYLVSSDVYIKEFMNFEKIVSKTSYADKYNSRDGKFNSYEELLSSKANKTWKRLQNEKLVKSIQVNWEMIPTSEKTTLHHYKKNDSTKIISNSEKSQADLKKAYDLVEEKMNYFMASNPVCKLKGINTFEGYSAYMYPNGVVVFEKFYKPKTVRTVDLTGKTEKKIMMIPVDGEAIYIMNFKNFADYSKHSKIALIEESVNNPDISRIYHRGNWENRLSNIINAPGVSELELEQVDEMAKQLAKERRV